jgi:hypothetical protein
VPLQVNLELKISATSESIFDVQSAEAKIEVFKQQLVLPEKVVMFSEQADNGMNKEPNRQMHFCPHQ